MEWHKYEWKKRRHQASVYYKKTTFPYSILRFSGPSFDTCRINRFLQKSYSRISRGGICNLIHDRMKRNLFLIYGRDTCISGAYFRMLSSLCLFCPKAMCLLRSRLQRGSLAWCHFLLFIYSYMKTDELNGYIWYITYNDTWLMLRIAYE